MRGLSVLLWLALALFTALPAFRRPRLLRRPRSGPDELVKDPVCQTYVVRSRAVTRTDRGEQHWFCSVACARRFTAGARG